MKKRKEPLRIAVIEDDRFWHQLIEKVLHEKNDFKVVLSCLWGHDFFDHINDHNIDLVLIDIALPATDGFEVSEQIKKMCPNLPRIIFTSSYNESDISRFYYSGIKAYLNKSRLMNLNEDLLIVMDLIKTKGYAFKPITYQDFELISMVCKKMTNNEMAIQLKTSAKNIENKLNRFCNSVNIKNTKLHIYEFAVRYGLWNPWKKDS